VESGAKCQHGQANHQGWCLHGCRAVVSCAEEVVVELGGDGTVLGELKE
jgi:hypothetical protein